MAIGLYGLVTVLVAQGLLIPIDVAVENRLAAGHQWPRQVSGILAHAGQGGPLASAVFILAAFQAWRLRNPMPLALWMIGFGLLFVLVGLPKRYLRRGAPADMQENAVEFFSKPFCGNPSCTSYPSGHAANAVVWYGLAGLLLVGIIRSGLLRTILLSAIAITAVTSVLSGFHWVSDAVAGVLAGLAIYFIIRIVALAGDKLWAARRRRF